jgi:nitrate reductase gamma subunit
MSIINYAVYISVLIFLIAVIVKIIKIAKAPLHLRWELYPLPHEKGKSQYGGSRLEEVDWWIKPLHKNHFGDWKVMIPEIIFLKAVWEHNKSLWLGSFPFHFALYMLFSCVILTTLGALMNIAGYPINAQATGLNIFLFWLIKLLIWIGGGLGIIGSIRLIFSRIVESGLRNFSSPSHFFNIILIGGIYFTVFLWSLTDADFMSNLIGFYTGLITLQSIPELPLVVYFHIWLSVFFLIYLPFTHMTHFFVKYFTYHKIRWEDKPNLMGSKMQKKISDLLNQPVSWSAPHIGADGKKTWIAIASSSPEKKQ